MSIISFFPGTPQNALKRLYIDILHLIYIRVYVYKYSTLLILSSKYIVRLFTIYTFFLDFAKLA